MDIAMALSVKTGTISKRSTVLRHRFMEVTGRAMNTSRVAIDVRLPARKSWKDHLLFFDGQMYVLNAYAHGIATIGRMTHTNAYVISSAGEPASRLVDQSG